MVRVRKPAVRVERNPVVRATGRARRVRMTASPMGVPSIRARVRRPIIRVSRRHQIIRVRGRSRAGRSRWHAAFSDPSGTDGRTELHATKMKVCMRHAIALVGLLGSLSCACAQDFRIEDSRSLGKANLAQLKPDTVLFNDMRGDAGGTDNLVPFADWAQANPVQKKFLSFFPSYTEPTIIKAASANHPAGPMAEKLVMYIAEARFLLDRAPGTLDLSRYVT